MAQDASSGRPPGPARRLADYLWQPDEQPAVPAASRAADAILAVVATLVAVLAVIQQFRTAGTSIVFPIRPGVQGIRIGAPPPQFPPAGTLLAAALTTAPLAYRRTYPIMSFCVVLGAVIASSGHTTTITFAAAILAAYSAVAYSPYRRAALLTVLAAAVVVTAAYPDTTPPVPERFSAMLILLPTVAVGVAIRVWRRRASESAERLRQAQAEHDAQTRRAVALERARIAAEMHDVVTHNVSVMVVQAGAARRVLDSAPQDARAALLAVEASGRTAMTELRHLLGLLAPAAGGAEEAAVSADDATLTPQPGLDRIPALVARVREAGMPVELSVEAAGRTSRDLPGGIDLAAFRVVQEALTNVMKHAGSARTTVCLEYRPRDLLITVSNDEPVPGHAPGPQGGRGLIGLRERIALYGGELDAGPRPGGGWRLVAGIPLDPAAGDVVAGAEVLGVSG